jgi:predicted nucleic-acid-binding Zn-ribbon protein
MDKCPRCGSTEREDGKLFVKQTGWDIRFKSNRISLLSWKKKVQAAACTSCGHVELSLEDRPHRDET